MLKMLRASVALVILSCLPIGLVAQDFSPSGNRELNIAQISADMAQRNERLKKEADDALRFWHLNWDGWQGPKPPQPGPVTLSHIDADLFRELWDLTGNMDSVGAAYSTSTYFPQYQAPAPPPPTAYNAVLGPQVGNTNVFKVGPGDNVPAGVEVDFDGRGKFVKRASRANPFAEEKIWYERKQ